ncbi:MAG TPA: hypothetical protein VGG73_21270 [Vicinamibacterales bacterium]|jgi:hypothetical protein
MIGRSVIGDRSAILDHPITDHPITDRRSPDRRSPDHPIADTL